MTLKHLLSLTCLSVVFALPCLADNWGSWRGPTSNGLSTETNVPTEWSAEKNVAWRFPLPGPAGATPAVWDDRVFVTTVDGADLLLICVGTDGKEQWRHKIGQGNKDVRGDEGNSASPSPITDGKYVWSCMATGDLACFTVGGESVWKIDLQERYGAYDIAFGMSATPVLHDGRLFLQLIHGDRKAETQEAVVAAIDAATGEPIWKSGRVTGAYNENEHSYASPMLYNFGGVSYLITHGADYTVAYSLNDGKEVWRLGGLNPQDDPKQKYHPTLRFVASTGAADGIIVCPTAKNGPVYAIRADQTGDLTGKEDAILWMRKKNTPDVPSPLIHEDLVYLCRENGMLLVLDRESGEEVYMKRTYNNRHRASPIYADGNLYLTARDGKVTVVKAGREFAIVAQNDTGEAMSASPVIANGTIYLRTFDALWAIRK
jgi:outer membrane protein assembly factor BamB